MKETKVIGKRQSDFLEKFNGRTRAIDKYAKNLTEINDPKNFIDKEKIPITEHTTAIHSSRRNPDRKRDIDEMTDATWVSHTTQQTHLTSNSGVSHLTAQSSCTPNTVFSNRSNDRNSTDFNIIGYDSNNRRNNQPRMGAKQPPDQIDHLMDDHYNGDKIFGHHNAPKNEFDMINKGIVTLNGYGYNPHTMEDQYNSSKMKIDYGG